MASFDKRKGVWNARIRWRGELQFLGVFQTEEDAREAEQDARETWKAYGEWEKEFGLPK